MSTIPIVYLGNKDIAFDNVAHSGRSWHGNGDVQYVTPAQAKLLLKHPKVWGLKDQADAAIVAQPVKIEVKDEDGEQVKVDTDDLRKPLEKMSKPELIAFAYTRWGKHLDARRSTKLLIDQIEEMQRGEPELV